MAACPQWYLPWVSYAQMERRAWATDPIERWHRCRGVLQRALALNPHSPHITQAWGLMELQRGNFVPAIVLLERCAGADRRCEPVLRWKLVRDAKQLVSVRRRR